MDDVTKTPETDTPQSQGETPEKNPAEKAALTPEQYQKQLDDMARHAKNKEEEAARVQKKLEKFEKDEAERKKAEMSEVERVKAEKMEADARAEIAEKALINERVKNAIYAEANKAVYGEKKSKFVSADVVYKLLDLSEIVIEDGKVKGVENALKALAKESPFLLEQPPAGDGVGSPVKNRQKNNSTETKPGYIIPRL